MTNFDVNMTSFLGGVPNYVLNLEPYLTLGGGGGIRLNGELFSITPIRPKIL